MHKFSEELLQHIWRYKLLKPGRIISTAGTEIEIIHPGELNVDSGPDFFNAQIKVNGITLAGNVELHIFSSDWLKHNHQSDRSYDRILLHVVWENDVNLTQNIENNVEVVELKDLVAAETLLLYETLAAAKDKLPCAGQLSKVDDEQFNGWMIKMAAERISVKVGRVEELFIQCNRDYTQTFYSLLLRNFGFKVNSFPFHLLSQQLPLTLLLKHADNLQQLEALLLGMCGLLEKQLEHPYLRALQNEFEYLRLKYQLQPLQSKLFKFSRMRPSNFPDLRLAQFARLIFSNRNIFVTPEVCNSYETIMKVLEITVEGYWEDHYKADGLASKNRKGFGKDSAENLIINSFVPFFFFYSKKLEKPQFAELAKELLESCKSEENAKTRLFHHKKYLLKNASSSQAIINLYEGYCTKKKCLKCGIAASLLNTIPFVSHELH